MKPRKSLFLVILSTLAACAPADAREPQSIVPVRVDDQGAELASLKGWTAVPKPHSQNRIVFRQSGYTDARSMTVLEKTNDFPKALRNALAKEGFSGVSIMAMRDVRGAIPNDFSLITGNGPQTFRSWVATAKLDGMVYKVAGLSVISSDESDPATSVEMFVAPVDEFEALGGYVVPVVRFLDNTITDPPAQMREWGAAPDETAVERMDFYFAKFMAEIIRGYILRGIMNQQTLGMLQGLGANGDYGLNDPIYQF